MKTALITGITGQDGSYLAELLLGKGYTVHGTVRPSSQPNTQRIDALLAPGRDHPPVVLHFGDATDGSVMRDIVDQACPDEVYHLAAQSHVGLSFSQPEYTSNTTFLGTVRTLEAVLRYRDRTGHPVRFFQPSSSEMFGATPSPQNERSPFHPRSPYAIAKLGAYWETINYREGRSLFAANGILFNHESERRPDTFVTRKITRAAARIKAGLETTLALGDLSARRDWGYAPDYVDAMWRIVQHDRAEDFVIATGESHSVRELVELAFGRVGLDPDDFVVIDPRHVRPTEVYDLEGDATKAREVLGWRPTVSFVELVERMLAHDQALADRELWLRTHGP